MTLIVQKMGGSPARLFGIAYRWKFDKGTVIAARIVVVVVGGDVGDRHRGHATSGNG